MTGPGHAARPVKPRERRRGLLLAKIIVTVAIFAFLFSRIDLSASAEAIRASLGFWLLFALAVTSLALITSTLKWDRLLRALGIFASKWSLLQIYTIGFFASSFLPGAVGGDVVRWHLTAKETGRRLNVAATILMERVTGVVALMAVCSLAIAVAVPRFATLPVLALLAAAILGLTVGLALALNRRLVTVLVFRTRRLPIRPIINPIYKLHRTLRQFPLWPLFVALGWSILFYLSIGLVFYAICEAFGTAVTFPEAISVQALISLITLIPISIGGLGLAQAGDVYLLGLLGVDAPTALGISLIRLLISYTYAALGGILVLRGASCRVPEA